MCAYTNEGDTFPFYTGVYQPISASLLQRLELTIQIVFHSRRLLEY